MKLDKDRVRALWLARKTYAQIAAELGVSLGVIAGVIDRHRRREPKVWPRRYARKTAPQPAVPPPVDPELDEAARRSIAALRAFPGILPDERDRNEYGRPAGKPAYVVGAR